MGETTAISWCDHTFNPWIGCTKVSPACDGCYAENLMATRYGRVKWGGPGKGNGTRERTSAGNWSKPLAWNRKAAAAGTRPFVFCASLADVFDNQVPAEWRRDLFELIRQTPNLVWLLLTKRPQNIVNMAEFIGGLPFPANAAIGATIEDQTRADINVPHLLDAKAALNPAFAFLSCEPLLGPIDLTSIDPTGMQRKIGASGWSAIWKNNGLGRPWIDWVITGGETDQGSHKARPSHPYWFRTLRDQCASARVPYHHKQNGEWHDSAQHDPEGCDGRRQIAIHVTGATESRPSEAFAKIAGIRRDRQWAGVCRVGKKRAGRLLDGVEHNARPEVRAA